MLIPDMNKFTEDRMNRFAVAAGVAKIANTITDRTHQAFEKAAELSRENNDGRGSPKALSVEITPELQSMLEEKPVTQAFKQFIDGKDKINVPED